NKIFPLRICDLEKQYHYDLIYLTNTHISHYAVITNLNKLIRSQLSKHEESIVVCKRCLTSFQGAKKDEKLEDHKKYCNKVYVKEPAHVHLPKEGEVLKFDKWEYAYPLKYIAFADFECILQPIDDDNSKNTRKTHKHVPISFCYYIVGPENTKFKGPIAYTGPDAVKVFYNMISEDAQIIEKMYNEYKNMPDLSQEEQQYLYTHTKCCICNGELKNNEKIVIHHDHSNNKVEGYAHNKCNLRVRCPTYLPVFLHNMSNYDGHLILKGYDKNDVGDLQVIPSTEEKYISFSKCVTRKLNNVEQKKKKKKNKKLKTKRRFWLRFVDSYRFLSSSLRNLVELLPQGKLYHTSQYFENPIEFSMAQQKSFFCYEYLDKIEKLKERALPPYSAFYSSLDKKNITEEEYNFAQKAWSVFKCSTLADYVTVYCKIDVLLLVDVFIEFRKKCMETYQLDVCQFFSLPGYTLQAMLKCTKIELELLTDIDQILFLERALRGGITQCISRFEEANNIYTSSEQSFLDKTINEESISNVEPNKTNEKSILYIDCNNLYGWALCEALPYSGFTWIQDTEFNKFTPELIMQLPENGSEGYYFQVDLKYPKELHDAHNEFPFCPEKKKSVQGTVDKLLCTLEDKTDYVLHYRMLQLCLKHGLQVEKIKKILKFNQSPYLRPYIELNTSLCQSSDNEFSKNLYKLLNNSLFGKTIERQRERINFSLYCEPIKTEKAIAKPSFKRSIIFDENLVGIHKYKQNITLNKPIYIGTAVLELSKLLMYQFFYEKLPIIFNNIQKPSLLYMDTDSFILSVKTADVTPYIQENLKFFDTSNYPTNHPCYSVKGKAMPGLFKDELGGKIIKKYIALCPKTYSIEYSEPNIDNALQYIKKAKGVQKHTVKNEIKIEDYERCLFDNVILKKEQINFRSKLHEIFTEAQIKTALQLVGDKRFFPQEDKIHSYAYGHYKIEKMS
ncbi:MAG TPA: hypothetical protein VEM27_11320, partial [Gemmatimonadales bacterium]|nr:hypothetical protein [Gemmatimonadales bacterium]